MFKNQFLGKFIVFDGLDGSGQSTQVELLADFLNEQKQKLRFGHVGVHVTKEPTSSLIGGLIRGQLSHEWKSSAECLQLLFAADRAHHLEKEIVPLLERGVTVVCDRYFFSTIAYGVVNIKDRDWLYQLNKHFLMPDLIFLLRISAKVCIERIKRSRFGMTLYEKEEMLEKVWENYEKLAKKFKNVYVLDGEQPADKIAKEVQRVVETKLRR